MLKRLLSILVLLAAVMLMDSCQKELPDSIGNIVVNKGSSSETPTSTPTPTPTPTPTQELKVSEPGQFSAKGGQQTITITATEAWTVSKSAGSDWLTVKAESGKAGTAQVDLVATENFSTESRKATITFKAGNLTKELEISQAAANLDISLSVDNLDFTSGSGSKAFSVTSNISWTVSSSEKWCSVSPTSGSNDGKVTVSVEENTSITERSATVTVQSETGNQTIKVIQRGAEPMLQLNKNDLSFMAESGSDSFTITSNTSWNVMSDQDWCTVSTSSGSNNGTITVNVSENKSTSSRSATITVKAGEQSQTIAVTQAGANPTLQLNKTSMAFESSNGSDSFTITSNTSWTIKSDKTWCTLSSSSGSNNATITVYVSENTSTSPRSTTITVKAGDLSQTITVTQAGVSPTLQLNKSSMSFESSSGSNSFTITSNTSWSITSNKTWCTLSSSSGSNDATVTVYVSENTSTSSRSATITVKAGDITQAIAVSQAGAKSDDKLTGANWEGWLGTYYQNRWGKAFKDGEYRTVWRFDAAYYDDYGAATYGTGYEVDYSTTNRNEYAYSPFNWSVRNGDIYIEYSNPNFINVRIDYRNYSISNNHFKGTMYDWENRKYDFDMENNPSWDWDYYRRYRTRAADASATDGLPVCISEDGQSVATGKFAEILNKRKASR